MKELDVEHTLLSVCNKLKRALGRSRNAQQKTVPVCQAKLHINPECYVLYKTMGKETGKKMKTPTNVRIFPLGCTLVYLVYRYLAPNSAINTIVLESSGYKWCI